MMESTVEGMGDGLLWVVDAALGNHLGIMLDSDATAMAREDDRLAKAQEL
jgi:hypothetical protein